MLVLENKIIECINKNDKKNTLTIYKKLYDLYVNNQTHSSSPLRFLKNQLISLNGILFSNSFPLIICSCKLNSKRFYYMRMIEQAKDINDLYSIGEEMICFSLDIRKKEDKTDNFIVNLVLKYIDENLDGSLTLKKTSKNMYISQNYLSFLFSKNMNCSFSEYVKMKKIEKAKELLEDSSLSLLDIALESGFNSQSYFCSVFKQFEKISPNQYRNKIQ